MRYSELLEKYLGDNPKLLETVTLHSRAVADFSLEIARSQEFDVDLLFIEEAAMLHDIGVVRCNAPSIYCYGERPYICHGIEGAAILRSEGMERHARVCERHTGAGLSREDIIRQNLPLPHRDYLPETLEEKIICYADKFYSKSGNLTERKSHEKVIASMAAHGGDSLSRFKSLEKALNLNA